MRVSRYRQGRYAHHLLLCRDRKFLFFRNPYLIVFAAPAMGARFRLNRYSESALDFCHHHCCFRCGSADFLTVAGLIRNSRETGYYRIVVFCRSCFRTGVARNRRLRGGVNDGNFSLQ